MTRTQAQQITVSASTIREAIRLLHEGMDNTDELLSAHEQELGRTTDKNRLRAESYDADIRDMRKLIDELWALIKSPDRP